mgnify:CR=1 FL=1
MVLLHGSAVTSTLVWSKCFWTWLARGFSDCTRHVVGCGYIPAKPRNGEYTIGGQARLIAPAARTTPRTCQAGDTGLARSARTSDRCSDVRTRPFRPRAWRQLVLVGAVGTQPTARGSELMRVFGAPVVGDAGCRRCWSAPGRLLRSANGRGSYDLAFLGAR